MTNILLWDIEFVTECIIHIKLLFESNQSPTHIKAYYWLHFYLPIKI